MKYDKIVFIFFKNADKIVFIEWDFVTNGLLLFEDGSNDGKMIGIEYLSIHEAKLFLNKLLIVINENNDFVYFLSIDYIHFNFHSQQRR